MAVVRANQRVPPSAHGLGARRICIVLSRSLFAYATLQQMLLAVARHLSRSHRVVAHDTVQGALAVVRLRNVELVRRVEAHRSVRSYFLYAVEDDLRVPLCAQRAQHTYAMV